jgi:hypothetical protein
MEHAQRPRRPPVRRQRCQDTQALLQRQQHVGRAANGCRDHLRRPLPDQRPSVRKQERPLRLGLQGRRRDDGAVQPPTLFGEGSALHHPLRLRFPVPGSRFPVPGSSHRFPRPVPVLDFENRWNRLWTTNPRFPASGTGTFRPPNPPLFGPRSPCPARIPLHSEGFYSRQFRSVPGKLAVLRFRGSTPGAPVPGSPPP